MPPSALEALTSLLTGSTTDLRAWAVAFARVLPAVLLVPAFGLQAVVTPARVGLALAMALAVAPAVRPALPTAPLAVALLAEVAQGLPVAVGAAAAIWAASMAGALIDNLRSSREEAMLPLVEAPATPSGALLGMLVAIAFLESGGAERVAWAMTAPPAEFTVPLARVVVNLHASIVIALATAAPLVVASIVVEVAGALITRAASPAPLQSIVAPLRSVALLGIGALLLDRMVELLVLFALRSPG